LKIVRFCFAKKTGNIGGHVRLFFSFYGLWRQDIGHGLFYGEEPDTLFADIPRAAHIHYHGIRDGRDHQALGPGQQACSNRLGQVLHAAGFTGVVTLEVYRSAELQASLKHLEESWLHYHQQKR